MLRTIIWYFKFAFLLIITYPAIFWAKYLLKKGRMEEYCKFCFESTSKWAGNRIKDSKSTINVQGLENLPEENVVFISNHQSDFDIAIFMALIPKYKGFIAKMELKKVPILRTWMEYIGCVFMDRKDLRQSVNSINDAIKSVKAGHSMVIFPEGTRSKCDKIGEFKAGSFKLATKSKVPIVPVTMDGSYKIKEANGGFIKPAYVNVYIHEPIYTECLSKEEKEALPERVKEIIKSKLPNQE